MPITTDWQIELRGLTLGALTDYPITMPGIDGLGLPRVQGNDLALPARHGDVGGIDVLQRRILLVPVGIDATGPSDAYGKLQALKAAWRPSSSDLGFDVRLPGQPVTVLRYYGRPRAVEMDPTRLRNGWLDVMVTFEALDPLGYGPETTMTITAPATTGGASNAGDIETDRIVLVVTGNGGTPVVTNTTTGGAVTFATTLANAATRTIDMRARTISGGSYAEISPASEWFSLAPGNNILSLAGAASVGITWRSAWT